MLRSSSFIIPPFDFLVVKTLEVGKIPYRLEFDFWLEVLLGSGAFQFNCFALYSCL